jgi:hypothetical protein
MVGIIPHRGSILVRPSFFVNVGVGLNFKEKKLFETMRNRY